MRKLGIDLEHNSLKDKESYLKSLCSEISNELDMDPPILNEDLHAVEFKHPNSDKIKIFLFYSVITDDLSLSFYEFIEREDAFSFFKEYNYNIGVEKEAIMIDIINNFI